MSEQTEAPEPDFIQNDDPHPDPFDGNSIHFPVTRRIDVTRLQEEISTRIKSQVMVSLSLDAIDHIASEEHPAVLFISPKNVNERVVREVVKVHVAGPPPQTGSEAGAPQVPSNTINPALLPDEVQPLVEKLREGKDLKTSEASDLLRAVFGIESTG